MVGLAIMLDMIALSVASWFTVETVLVMCVTSSIDGIFLCGKSFLGRTATVPRLPGKCS